jgi:hypothetical protein
MLSLFGSGDLLAGLVYLVAGLAFLAMSALIRRRGRVAEVYGGERMAPFWRYLCLIAGVAWLGVAVVQLV